MIAQMFHRGVKPISSSAHSVLDYLTVGTCLALPRMMGASPRICNAVAAVALGKLAYSALTRHEGGIVKLIPLRTHLALDAAGGAAIAAAPFVLEEDDPAVAWTLVAIGLFDIIVAPLTQAYPEDAILEDDACWAGFAPLIEAEAF